MVRGPDFRWLAACREYNELPPDQQSIASDLYEARRRELFKLDNEGGEVTWDMFADALEQAIHDVRYSTFSKKFIEAERDYEEAMSAADIMDAIKQP